MIMASTPTEASKLSTTDDIVAERDSTIVMHPVDSAADEKDENAQVDSPATIKPTLSISCIFACLCLFSFLSALDGTIITTALPTITGDIGGGGNTLYVWIAQCFMFSSTVPQPLYGQLANIFGRRNPFLIAIALFILGSGIAGGSTSPTMLIAGRTVQGLGAAGLYVLSDIIVCDMIPPRHRGPYISAVLSAAGIGSTIGPIIGGALAERNWRWIFYLNVPAAGFGFLIMVLMLRVKHKRSPTWMSALKRVDYIGSAVFIPSMISLFLGLIMGGTQHPWSSWRVVLPLILGVSGWLLFHISQATKWLCPEPSVPLRLFSNRTSTTGYLFVFLSSVILQSIAYFLPLYFQAVKLVSPLLSGVYYLPFALILIPASGIGGWLLSKWGQYIPLHYIGFSFLTIGMGLFSILNENTNRGEWIGFQFFPAAGIGLIFTATLPSTLAALDESDVAVATATYSFIRSFGFVWGLVISGAVFNTQIDAHLYIITSEQVKQAMKNGAAYAYAASGDGLRQLPIEEMRQAMAVYVKALRVLWLVIMGIALLGFVCVPVERKLKLRTEHDTQFGLEDKQKKESEVQKY